MTLFTFNDVVRIKATAPAMCRPGALAWIIAVFTESRPGSSFDEFPPGTVYSVEFEDGSAIDIHESLLEAETNT